jgi:hypothetical protein
MFEKTWGGCYGNTIMYADEVANGDYILIGMCSFDLIGLFPGPPQLYMARIDKTGELLWEKTYGDSAVEDFLSNVIKTKSGTYLLVGTSKLASYDPHVLNLDADGNIIFDTYYTVGGGYFDSGTSICETTDSCYVFACYLNVLSGSHTSPTLIKIDKLGNEIWRVRQDSLMDYVPQIIRTFGDSGFIVVGMASSVASSNSYVCRYKNDGNLQWIKYPYGWTSTISNGEAGLKINSDYTFEVPFTQVDIPNSNAPSTSWKTFDSDGNIIGQKSFNYFLSLGGHSTSTPSLTIDGLNTISTINPYGYCGQWITKIDQNKNVTFCAKMFGQDSTYKLLDYTIQTSDGGYLSVGINDKSGDTLQGQFYVVKFGVDGRYQPDDFLSSIVIYPLPSSDGNITATFDSQKDATLDVRILSADGKLVYQSSLFLPANSQTELPIRLDEQSVRSGMYILEARTENEIYRKKLIISRANR